MQTQSTDPAQPQLTRLRTFRQALYGCFDRAADALFELLDALLLSPHLDSFPELSCLPVFRRRWPSLYAALQDGRLDARRWLQLAIAHLPPRQTPLLVGDHTAWPRLHAPTLQDRTVQHQPTPIAGQKPITIGYGFSTLGVVPAATGSWFLPLRHERLSSQQTPSQQAAAQLRSVVEHLPARPLALYDSEYGSGAFFRQTATVASDLLVRLRANRKLYRAAPPYAGHGRPAKHGAVLRFKDPATWGAADEQFVADGGPLGQVRVQAWHDLHFYEAPDCPLTLLRLERPQAPASKRQPKVVWLGYRAHQRLPLAELWPQYLRRYVVEHWYRFINRNLHWRLPAVSTAPQSQLWSELMVLASWQLYLARDVVEEQARPWQKRKPELSPGRVQQSLGGVLLRIGTPAKAPKPRGKSPGWPKGRVRQRRPRYGVLKKPAAAALPSE